MTVSAVPFKPAFDALRNFTRREKALERCELCATGLAEEHAHLIETATSRLLCACEACSILFYRREGESKYRRVPRRGRRLVGFHLSDAEWNALMLPIDLVFLQNNTRVGRVIAYYPSPAGCTESLLDLTAWRDILQNNPVLEQLLPDVETLLVNRTRGRRHYYIAPVDKAYRLAGLIRMHWEGLSGGEVVWRKIDEFFESLDANVCRT